MSENDGYGEPIPDIDLPENERLNAPDAADDVQVPAADAKPAEPEEGEEPE